MDLKEASEAAKLAFYECGVLDMKVRLAEEVAGMCRDYYTEVWVEALNRAGVPADSELRSAESTFFPEDIQETPAVLPPPEQISTIQAASLDAAASTRVGKGKEVPPPAKDIHSEDALTIKNVVSQAKDAKSKSKDGDVKLKASDSKKGHHQAKA